MQDIYSQVQPRRNHRGTPCRNPLHTRAPDQRLRGASATGWRRSISGGPQAGGQVGILRPLGTLQQTSRRLGGWIQARTQPGFRMAKAQGSSPTQKSTRTKNPSGQDSERQEEEQSWLWICWCGHPTQFRSPSKDSASGETRPTRICGLLSYPHPCPPDTKLFPYRPTNSATSPPLHSLQTESRR